MRTTHRVALTAVEDEAQRRWILETLSRDPQTADLPRDHYFIRLNLPPRGQQIHC